MRQPLSLRYAFDWQFLESAPRVSRPLSNILEVLDTHCRIFLWRFIPPHPAFSLAHIFTLVISPLLLYRILRLFGTSVTVAFCGIALYLSNPGILSLLAMNFRPAKAMACFSLLLAIYWAARIGKNVSEKHQGPSLSELAPLYVFLLLSLFWDEIAVISIPALLVLFPGLVLSSYASAASFLAIPALYIVAITRYLPAVHAWLGFPLLTGSAYRPMERFTALIGFGLKPGGYGDLFSPFLKNSQIALGDCLGLINPGLPDSAEYYLYFSAIVIGVLAGCVAIVRKNLAGSSRTSTGPLMRTTGLLVLSLIAHTILLHTNGNEIWGMYWYGAFIAAIFVIWLSVLTEYTKIPAFAVVAFAFAIVGASHYVFPRTNQAYKEFHYYPYRPILLRRVFENEINRFALPGGPWNAENLDLLTRQLWSARQAAASVERAPRQSVYGAPRELLYVAHELGLAEEGFDCGVEQLAFNLLWDGSSPRIQCSNYEQVDTRQLGRAVGAWWYNNGHCSIHPPGADTLIAVNQRGESSAVLVRGDIISALDWSLSGRISEDNQSIAWANGTVWKLDKKSPAPEPGHMVVYSGPQNSDQAIS
jgi:hypothetical protein